MKPRPAPFRGTRIINLLSLAVFALLSCNSYEAFAQTEVTLLSPSPLRDEFEKLIPDFEKKTNSKVVATWGDGVSTRNDVAAGKAADVCVLYSPFPEALASGNLDRNSAKPLVKLRLGISLKKGSARADVSTAEAVKRLVLAAKSVTTVDPAQGSVGAASVEALKKLGIYEQVKAKLKFFANGGLVSAAVAKGEIELGLGPYISDINSPDLEILGAMPEGIAPPTEVFAYLSARPKNPAAAKALLNLLSSREAADVYKASRLQPAY